MSERPAPPSPLAYALSPTSIAVVGASDDTGKVGGLVLSAILANEFQGEVFPVNPRGGEIQGLASYPSLEAIHRPIDLAVLCVPKALVQENVEAAGRAAARAVVVLASGYGELGAAGSAAQAELVATAERHNLVLIGPNCLGLMNGRAKMAATSSILMPFLKLEPGRASLVTQSGALGTYWLDAALDLGMGVGKWVTTGNEASTTYVDVLDHLVEDEDTDIVSAYVEGIRDGLRLREVLDKAARKHKPVIVLRSGRTSQGAKAVASHTGSLAGEDQTTAALLEQYGVCEADSISEMVDLARIFDAQTVRPGRRACIITLSGGAGALIADAAHWCGLEVPDLPPDVVDGLREFYPSFANLANPIDMTGSVIREEDMLGRTLDVVIRSDAFDCIFVFVSGRHAKGIRDYTAALTGRLKTWHGTHAVVWKSPPPGQYRELQGQGVVAFDETTSAVRALSRAVIAAEKWETFPAYVPAVRPAAGAEWLSEIASKEILSAHAGLRCPPGRLLRDPAETAARLDALQAPYVAKLQSADMLHKSGHGGIALSLRSIEEVRTAVADMADVAATQGLRFEGVLVEQMVRIQYELILGFRVDPNFGPLVVLGRGGTAVEVDPDVVRAFLPLTDDQIAALVRRLRMYPLLAGHRGKAAVAMDELVATIQRVAGLFLAQHQLTEIEINPLAIDDRGDVWALDALIATTATAIHSPATGSRRRGS